jgi:hypothetical protein
MTMKKLLLALALCTAAYAPVRAEDQTCSSKYCYTDELAVELTADEQYRLDVLKAQMVRIIAKAGERKERAEQQEAARIKRCTIPFLRVGCPPQDEGLDTSQVFAKPPQSFSFEEAKRPVR